MMNSTTFLKLSKTSMNTNAAVLHVGGMNVSVVRKPIKNLHLSILPPDGNVRVSSPLQMKDEVIRSLVATKIPWIRKQKAKFQGQERQSPREYVSGETHYVFGRPHRLELLHANGRPGVEVRGKNKIVLRVPSSATLARRAGVMTDWYRGELRTVSAQLLEIWQKEIGVALGSWGIKKMKTRWGTCNQRAARVWLNLELAKKPLPCIEYVVVHELLHLIEKKHNQRFVDLLTKHQPKWRSTKQELNQFILSHETWNEPIKEKASPSDVLAY
jgi:predicted metal-dependent hydrolase